MTEFKETIGKLAEDVVELKISAKATEITLKHNTTVLDRLTQSVEEHVARSNRLEELVGLVRQEAQFNEKKLESHIHMVGVIAKVIGITLAAIGSVILGLYQMGILQKIF